MFFAPESSDPQSLGSVLIPKLTVVVTIASVGVTFHNRWNWIIAMTGHNTRINSTRPPSVHAALIINFPTYIARLSILCMMHRNVPYKHYSKQAKHTDIQKSETKLCFKYTYFRCLNVSMLTRNVFCKKVMVIDGSKCNEIRAKLMYPLQTSILKVAGISGTKNLIYFIMFTKIWMHR